MNSSGINGRTGVKWITVVPVVVLIVTGGAMWGENRLTTATNVTNISELKETHSKDIEAIVENQEELDDKLNDVVTEQRLIQNEIEHIKDSQERQEDLSKQILDILKDE